MAFTRRFVWAFCILLLASMACGQSKTIPLTPATPENSIFDSGKTAYGFFPSPPKASLESILQLYKDMGKHGNFVDDFNLTSYAEQMKKDGRTPQDAVSLGAFAHIGLLNSDGSPKPALEVWDAIRSR